MQKRKLQREWEESEREEEVVGVGEETRDGEV